MKIRKSKNWYKTKVAEETSRSLKELDFHEFGAYTFRGLSAVSRHRVALVSVNQISELVISGALGQIGRLTSRAKYTSRLTVFACKDKTLMATTRLTPVWRSKTSIQTEGERLSVRE